MAAFKVNDDGCYAFYKEAVGHFVTMVFKNKVEEGENKRPHAVFYVNIALGEIVFRQDWVGLAGVGTEVLFCDANRDYKMGEVVDDDEKPIKGWEGFEKMVSTDRIVQEIKQYLVDQYPTQ